MTKNMYTVAGDGPCNEELALRMQAGDKNAAGRLVSQNEGYLTDLARAYTPWCEMEDLKQEAALALLDAAGHFDPAYGTKLLTYATPAIEAALSDYAAQHSSSLSIPISRYNQLRRVAYLCAEGWDSSDAELVKVVCGELNVSAKVAGALIKEYRTLFCVRQLGDDVFSVSCGGDPAVAYDRLMRRTLLMQRMEQVLTPRELNLVRSYLGIGQPDEVGMTFQELAIYLNYNGPSGAEKAYKSALRKLKKDLYGGAYGRWLSAQKAIRAAKAEAEQETGQSTTPQRTWWGEKELMARFICEVVSLIRVHKIFSDALENIAAKIFEES
ncbi:sigma factor [uncultured Oscillibacter sp.]|uniref:sigma factor n=1 Tax=uncultured Oscillibacter sp. TaxID=876091 RepID=UPI0025FA9B55|nr:sigma factor [uncultured Oscillibacter sp.]